jgi:hypothetical protein
MAVASAQQTIICMKWGTRYGPEYVNRLASMVRRNVTRPTRLLCFTDNADGVAPDIETTALPSIAIPERISWWTWRKLSVWQDPLADLSGDVVFLDLDLVIVGSLDPFFDFEPGRYAAIENWTQPGQRIGNTSVFRFPVGRYTHIFHNFERDAEAILRRWRTEQHYISDTIGDMVFWPKAWCVSFKHSLLPRWPLNFLKPAPLPKETKIVAFTGRPKPHEALVGKWPVRTTREKIYKHTRPTPWIGEHWR